MIRTGEVLGQFGSGSAHRPGGDNATDEILSALARRHRETPNDTALAESRSLLDELSRYWSEVAMSREVIDVAAVLLFRHILKAADALQLATALTIGREQPFVTLDAALARAARDEGLDVQP